MQQLAIFIAGPLLAGLLITVIDFYTYLVAAGLMLVSAALYMVTTAGAYARTERSLSMLIAGITYVRTNSIVFGAIALDLFIVLAGSVMALLPVYATDVLQVGPDALGMLRGAPALAGYYWLYWALPPMRRSGLCLFVALVVFST